MKINFKKITALATSALMVGMTMGAAAAANYPAPFVSGGAADVAIVYGTGAGVSQLDLIEAGNIQTNLQSFMTGTSTGGSVSTSGEVISLDTSADRIWLNTSLNAVKSTITKSDLPTVLADYTFSGDVTSKVTSSVKLVTGNANGAENSGKVIFAKQPTSSDDPAVAISMGTSQTSYPLYNATATMSAINFTSADSEGEEIVLFGQSFTIAADTTGSSLVLLKEAEKLSLSSDAASGTVTVAGSDYTVELVSASDTTATIKVTDSAGSSQTKEVSEADSKRINGIDVAVTNADENNLKYSASVIAGSEKVTLADGAIVTLGEDDDPVDGTYAYIVGGNTANDNPVNSTTEITIAVFRPDSSTDAILAGVPFVDPVFGSFKLDFAGLSIPLDDAGRENISIANSGDDSMTIKMTEQGGREKSIGFAHNESNTWRLADDTNYSINVIEMGNLSYASGTTKYTVVGNEDYGHLLELYDVYNQTTGASAITNDRVKFKDVFTSETYETTFTSTEGSGTIDVDGKRYTVTFNGTGESAAVRIKYPTSDSAAANYYVVYPTIETAKGALVSLYEPLTINLSDVNGSMPGGLFSGTYQKTQVLQFPDGDNYVAVTATYAAGTNVGWNATWTISGGSNSTILNTTDNASSYTVVTVGAIKYNFTSIAIDGTSVNQTKIYALNPEDSASNIDNPGIIIFEGKDDNSAYEAIVVDLEGNAASMGSSTNGVGVSDVFISSDYYNESFVALSSDSDISKRVDWFGTLITKDASDSDQKTVEIAYPKSQVYANIYVGGSGATISSTSSSTSATQLGNVLVKDSEVSSVSTKNLVVVGGSCINSAAATLVGGAKCGAAWTTATGVGAGEFLIKGYATSTLTSKVALLVAGYEAADTVNAATYLRTKTVDTSKAYKGTTSTSATLITA